MSNLPLPHERLEKIFIKEIQLYIKEIAEDEIEKTKKEIDDKVHAKLSITAINLAKHYDIKCMTDRLVITINNKSES